MDGLPWVVVETLAWLGIAAGIGTAIGFVWAIIRELRRP